MIEYDHHIESFLEDLRNDIISSKNSSLITVNKNMFMLYWKIGNLILIRQNEKSEGEFISTAAQYFKTQFPNNLSFSEKNLKNMIKFAGQCQSQNSAQNIASKIGWSFSILLVDKIRDANKRMEYMDEALKKGWSVEKLAREIDLHYHMDEDEEEIHEAETTCRGDNFSKHKDKDIDDSPFIKDIILDEERDETQEGEIRDCSSVIKDEYLMDFIGCLNEEKSKYFQEQFVKSTIEFFLGLNSGFALVGRRYHVELSGGDYYIDLLFYNLKLKCYIAVELKIEKFKPEYLGILTFHLSILDESVRSQGDSSSIGIIICKDGEKLIVQYAFKDIEKPENDEYRLNENIPGQFQGILPEVEEIGRGIKNRLKSI